MGAPASSHQPRREVPVGVRRPFWAGFKHEARCTSMYTRREAQSGLGREEAEMVGRRSAPALGNRHDRVNPASTTARNGLVLGRLRLR